MQKRFFRFPKVGRMVDLNEKDFNRNFRHIASEPKALILETLLQKPHYFFALSEIIGNIANRFGDDIASLGCISTTQRIDRYLEHFTHLGVVLKGEKARVQRMGNLRVKAYKLAHKYLAEYAGHALCAIAELRRRTRRNLTLISILHGKAAEKRRKIGSQGYTAGIFYAFEDIVDKEFHYLHSIMPLLQNSDEETLVSHLQDLNDLGLIAYETSKTGYYRYRVLAGAEQRLTHLPKELMGLKQRTFDILQRNNSWMDREDIYAALGKGCNKDTFKNALNALCHKYGLIEFEGSYNHSRLKVLTGGEKVYKLLFEPIFRAMKGDKSHLLYPRHEANFKEDVRSIMPAADTFLRKMYMS